jgi:hypothetical protein
MAVAAALACLTLPAAADCNLVPFRVAQPMVESFVLRPDSLLRQHPRGGEQLVSATAIIASSSKTALPILVRTATTSDIAQRRGIAQGLAEAARLCEMRDVAHTRRIQAAIRAHPDPTLRETFNEHYRSRIDSENDLRSKRIADALARMAAAAAPMGGNLLFNPVDPTALGPLRSPVPPAPGVSGPPLPR